VKIRVNYTANRYRRGESSPPVRSETPGFANKGASLRLVTTLAVEFCEE
jgi:hypothetical protein